MPWRYAAAHTSASFGELTSHAGRPKIFERVPPRTSLRVASGTPFASNIALYCERTCSAPAGLVSVPKTILLKALGLFSGVAVPSPVSDHQKNLENSSRRLLSFVSVEPLKSKNTFGFHRAISAD